MKQLCPALQRLGWAGRYTNDRDDENSLKNKVPI